MKRTSLKWAGMLTPEHLQGLRSGKLNTCEFVNH